MKAGKSTGRTSTRGKGKSAKAAERPERAPPSSVEKKAIEAATADVAGRPPRFRMRLDLSDAGEIVALGAEHSDDYGWSMRLQSLMATHGIDLPISAVNQLVSMARSPDGKVDANRLNSMLAIVEGAQPSTEIEAVLACQMAATHFLAMELVVRARKADQIPQFDAAGNMAVRMLRTFTAQTEALTKLQKKHSQAVRVEHVHVHAGGQAVVGNVSREMPRGRGDSENEDQSHAKAQLSADSPARMPEVWSEDACRVAVPCSNSEE